jgi:hypothetical protein
LTAVRSSFLMAGGRLTDGQRRLPVQSIVRTNGSDEVLARAINLLIGRAAFETAKRMYPRDLLEYRHGAMVIERSGDH